MYYAVCVCTMYAVFILLKYYLECNVFKTYNATKYSPQGQSQIQAKCENLLDRLIRSTYSIRQYIGFWKENAKSTKQENSADTHTHFPPKHRHTQILVHIQHSMGNSEHHHVCNFLYSYVTMGFASVNTEAGTLPTLCFKFFCVHFLFIDRHVCMCTPSVHVKQNCHGASVLTD